jgi:hypothetical protein
MLMNIVVCSSACIYRIVFLILMYMDPDGVHFSIIITRSELASLAHSCIPRVHYGTCTRVYLRIAVDAFCAEEVGHNFHGMCI